MIIPVYQRLGTSTHLLAQKIGELHQTKSTHTGTLDPMAEGVVIVLTDDDRFKKEECASWKKTYEFQVVWGVSTDTQDLLGLASEKFEEVIVLADLDSRIKNILPNFLGTQTQLIPAFSSKRIDGQSYFDVARKNRDKNDQINSQQTNLNHTQEITIYSIVLEKTNQIPAREILDQLNKALPQIINDFRQEEIQKKWSDWINSLPQLENTLLPSTTFTTTTSKRTYIRSLVRDISKKLDVPATTFHIIRTANGPYQIQDCVCLV